MPRNTLDMVQEFHDETGIATPTFARVPDWSPQAAGVLLFAFEKLHQLSLVMRDMGAAQGAPRCIVRARIEIEELGEKLHAMAQYDLLALLDGQGDSVSLPTVPRSSAAWAWCTMTPWL